MVCDIARNLDGEALNRIAELEHDLGLTIVAYSCRALPPEREQRLLTAMAEMGLPTPVRPATPDAEQLAAIQRSESDLGVSLVAVDA